MGAANGTASDGDLHMFARWLGARDAASFWPLLLIHANITIYALTFWMQQPVMPFLSKELGADAGTFGSFSRCNSLFPTDV